MTLKFIKSNRLEESEYETRTEYIQTTKEFVKEN